MPAVAVAAAVLLLSLLVPAAAQGQPSPLRGQNSPGNETTVIYFSTYVDRLLEGERRSPCSPSAPPRLCRLAHGAPSPLAHAPVDERDYRHELILYTYLTWRDPAAYDTVVATTARWKAGEVRLGCLGAASSAAVG